MLYVTTRNQIDTYTVYHALHEDRSPDGGMFVPFRLPVFTAQELDTLAVESWGQRIAGIMNLFFGGELTGWDVDFCIGKAPVKLHPLAKHIVVSEYWHNHEWDISHIVKDLNSRITGEAVSIPSAWMEVAVRIALLFASYGELRSTDTVQPQKAFDIALDAGDLSGLMAAWYAREMGLPIGNIICGCHAHPEVWDLIHQNQMRTDGGVPSHLERLISGAFGPFEAVRYDAAVKKSRMYNVPQGAMELAHQGLYAAVISAERIRTLIPSVYRTCGYIPGPRTALAYGGLQDRRANTGESRLTLLLAERGPRADLEVVASSMEMTQQELLRQLGA